MTRRMALLVIFLSMVVIGIGYASAFLPGGAPRVATFAFALATAAVMTAIIVLGAARRRSSLGPLKWVFAFTFIVLAIGFSVALTQIEVETSRLFLGLPSGAAVILYGVGVLPLLVLPIAYALTFETTTLDETELEELRRTLKALKASASAAAHEPAEVAR